MSSVTSRSKPTPIAAAHPAAQKSMEIHGAPVLRVVRMNIRGRYPSSARTNGRREYDMTSELNIPNELMAPPSTMAVFSQGPTRLPAKAPNDAVSQMDAEMPLRDMAAIGIAYESATM